MKAMDLYKLLRDVTRAQTLSSLIQIQKMAKDTKQEREGWPSGDQM